jgi:translation elongation factor EF-1alpha
LGQLLHEVGRVSHVYDRIGVAVVEVEDTIAVGDQILIKGPSTDIEQTVKSMEIEHSKIQKAQSGQSIGIKVNGHVHTHDTIYKTE